MKTEGKIYLIEDRGDRVLKTIFFEKYKDELLNYKSVFEYNKQFNLKDSDILEDYIKTNFSDAKCVIFHLTHKVIGKRNYKIDEIKNAFFKNGTDFFIKFSGSIDNNVFEKEAVISAQTLYSSNLIEFLKKYKDENVINLSILAYGRKYLINELLSLSYLTHNYITDNDLDKEVVEAILNEELKSDEFKSDKETLKRWINSDKFNKAGLLKTIQNLIDKYENIN